MTVSITTDAVALLGRTLDARAYAVRTQQNTATFDSALARLDDAILQAESIMDFGEIPPGVVPSVWQAMEVSYQRAVDLVDTYEQTFPGDSLDTWDTFGVDQQTESQARQDDGVIRLEPITLVARVPQTSGEPDVVGTKTVGSALPGTSATTGTKGAAIEAFRQQQTAAASAQNGSLLSSPLVLGGLAFAGVGLFLYLRK